MIIVINHIGITTRHLDRMLFFYHDLMGMDIVATDESYSGDSFDIALNHKQIQAKVVLLQQGNFQLELFEFSNPITENADTTPKIHHAGFNQIGFLVENLAEEYQRLKQAGVSFLSKPVTIHSIEEQANYEKGVYGRDPDGNLFELFELIHN